MSLNKEEITIILNLLTQVSLPVGQTEQVLLPILIKLRGMLEVKK